MYYGKTKAKQMGRSILPSTRRKDAREELAKAKRANRHKINSQLKKIDLDDYEEDLNYYCDREINDIRRDRRNGDKLNHFIRWAHDITKDMPKEARLGFMRTQLPDGLIGDHAMSHLDRLEHFRLDEFKYVWRSNRYASSRPFLNNDRADVAERLDWLLRNNYHQAFNDLLKTKISLGHAQFRRNFDYTATTTWSDRFKSRQSYFETTYCDRCFRRLLYGLHDIEAFVEWWMKDRSQHGAFLEAVWHSEFK